MPSLAEVLQAMLLMGALTLTLAVSAAVGLSAIGVPWLLRLPRRSRSPLTLNDYLVAGLATGAAAALGTSLVVSIVQHWWLPAVHLTSPGGPWLVTGPVALLCAGALWVRDQWRTTGEAGKHRAP